MHFLMRASLFLRAYLRAAPISFFVELRCVLAVTVDAAEAEPDVERAEAGGSAAETLDPVPLLALDLDFALLDLLSELLLPLAADGLAAPAAGVTVALAALQEHEHVGLDELLSLLLLLGLLLALLGLLLLLAL